MEYPNLGEDHDEADAGNTVEEAAQVHKSPTAISNMSGTTARNSHSSGRGKDVNAEDLLDALPDTSEAADKVLDLLLPDVVDTGSVSRLLLELRDPNSRHSKKLRRLATAFHAQRESFGTDGLYLDVKETLKTILGAKVTRAHQFKTYKPDGVIFKINLATLLLMMTRNWEKSPDLELIEELEQDFPTPFILRFVDTPGPGGANSDLLPQTFDIAKSLRVQVTVFLLARHHDAPNFDPERIILQCYFNDDTQTLKGWDVPGLREADLTKEQQASLQDHIQKLTAIFSQDHTDSLGSLKDFYPWVSFVTDIIHWAKPRREEIDAEIDYQGGVEAIFEQLGAELQGREPTFADPNIDPALVDRKSTVQIRLPQRSTISPSLSTQTDGLRPVANMFPGLKTASNIARLKELGAEQKQAEAQRSRRDGAQTNYEETDDWHEPQIEEDMGAQLDSVDTNEFIRDIVSSAAREERASNKENIADMASVEEDGAVQQGSSQRALATTRSFIDRQAGATRLSFSDSQAATALSGPSGQSGKRKGFSGDDDEDMELSQDQGFQTHDHEVDVVARRRAKPTQRKSRVGQSSVGRSSKRARVVAPTDAADQGPASPEPSSSRGDIVPTSTYEAHRKANAQAKIISSMRPNKAVQTRKPWSIDETETLLHLIMNHGTSWSALKDIDSHSDLGEVLGSRDQVALKDKARNMKVDFLK